MKIKSLYYHLDGLNYGPKPGDFLVSIGKKGIGTVYHIVESRKAKASNRYNLKAFVADDLKPEAVVVREPYKWVRRRTPKRVTVRGIHAWLIFWFPRNKK
jgi:predicted nucleic acid-binding Zn finger protein